MRLSLCCLALICSAYITPVFAQPQSQTTQRVETVPAEKFFLRASDPARDLRFEISEKLRPRLLRGGSIIWVGGELPLWPQQTEMLPLGQHFRRAVFSPDGKLILVSGGKVARLYAVSDGAIVADLSRQVGSVFAFSSDSARIASVVRGENERPIISIWNIARDAAEHQWPLSAFERNVSGYEFYYKDSPSYRMVKELAWSPDDTTIYLGLSEQGRIVVPRDVRGETSVHWTELAALEVGTGQYRWQTPLEGPITRSYSDTFFNFALSPDGARLGCGVNGRTRLVDTRSGAILQTDVDLWFQNAGFSGDSRLFFVAARNEAHFYRARDGRFVGTRTLTGFSPTSVYNPGQAPYLDQHGGVITTSKGQFRLATMWKRGYDWDGQGARVRRLDAFYNIAWSPQGRAVTFDNHYIYRWNASMTRIEARYEHPFRRVESAQIDADEKTLWIWGDYYAEDLRHSYTRFYQTIGENESGSHVAAMKLDLTNDQWQLTWRRPIGIYGLLLSPDLKLGAVTQHIGQPYNSQSSRVSRRLAVSDTEILDARSGRVIASIKTPIFAGDVSISNPRPGGRLVTIHRSRAWETRLFVLEGEPRQLWNEQIGGGFFIPGSSDLFIGEQRVNTRAPRQITRFRGLNMVYYTRRGIFAYRQVSNYRTASPDQNIDGNGSQHIIVNRDGETLGILPQASLSEKLLDFAPNGQAVTREGDGSGLNFWRVQKPRRSAKPKS